ncbi:MAG: DUF721 domain-containing protein [Acidimicrobiia bacterium]|nr:DUF721 domain-containing protein [Acidimicrobiia bacterium]
MSHDRDLEPISESMEETFRKLGLPDPALMAQVSSEWESLAGKHWSGRSKPVSVRSDTLIVEAATPSMVAFLKYGETELLESLKNRFGSGVFRRVQVVPPGRV